MDNDKWFSNSYKIVMIGSALRGHSIQEYMDNFSVLLSVRCPECRNKLICSFLFVLHPLLICIELWQRLGILASVLHIEAGSLL